MSAQRGPLPYREPRYALEDRTTGAVLDRNAAERPGKPALRDAERTLTHGELRDEADRRGSAVAALGIGWQEPFMLMLDNHLDHVLTWLGATYHGRIQIQINTAYRANVLTHVLNNAGAATLVVDDVYCRRIADVADELVHLEHVVVRGGDGADLPPGRFEVLRFEDVLVTGPGGGPEQRVQPWHVYGILYTSGTTGLSKGVVIPHAQPYSYGGPEYFALAAPDDVVLVTLGQFHIGGQWAGVLAALFAGATAVIVDRFHVSTFWDDVRRFGITQTTVVSTMADFLYRQAPRPDDADTTLRRMLMAPIIKEAEEFKARFGVELTVGFGQTEASCPIVAPYGTTEPGASGWARPDFEVRVVDEFDREVPRGEVGELVVRPLEPWSVMLGYHGRPDATAEKWRNLWLHTGDLVRQDEEEQFWFVDRSNDAIRRRGENVASFEVESEIRAHPQVIEVAVIGVPSENYESEIMAWVHLVDGATVAPDELHTFVKERLPYFMVPRYFEFADGFAKTDNGRINKPVLRAAGVTATTWDAREHGLEARHHD